MIQLDYLFDPLCGWCYGATPMIATLADHAEIALRLVPTGLFAGPGVRRMDEAFAAYAWSSDQRIAQMTGQSFTEAYRRQVLAVTDQLLDSGPASLTLTAVTRHAPERERETLRAIQEARYVEGQDITSLPVLLGILERLDLPAAAAELANPSDELLAADEARITEGRTLMAAHRASGVPALIRHDGDETRLLRLDALFGDFTAFLGQLGLAQPGRAAP
ncbi:DsbA family protein [Bosea sp. LjRoot9]|uniref:DsbA family protein n=1 Tax=Bosea sp. LjRoot9 TaxID=3342341 RepID=UPI003ECC654C